MRLLIFILYLSLLSIAQSFGQTFKYIGMEDGLSSQRVLSICQGAQDYIWILTHKGVDRYNGKQFNHYILLKEGIPLSFYPDLNTLNVDADRTLWEYGKDGYVFCFNELRDTFQLVFDLRKQFPQLKKQPVTAVYFDSQKRIWFCSKGKQYIYDTQTQTGFALSGRIEEEIISITEDAEKGIYYLASQNKIHATKLDKTTLKSIKDIQIKNISVINYIYFHANSRQLIVNTLANGLLIYNPENQEADLMGDLLRDIRINRIIPYYKSPNEILIATDGDGVYWLDMKAHDCKRFLQENYLLPNKMNGSIIKDIYIDTAHRIWNVIYPTGLTVYSEQYPTYEWITHSRNNTNSLVDNRINGIMQDSEGDTWFATNNGISCYNPQQKKWYNYLSSFDNNAHNDNHVFISLCEIKPGVIMAGGYMSGIYIIYKQNGQVKYVSQLSNEEEPLPDKYIRSIFRDNDGNIWTGGFYCLRMFNPTDGKRFRYNTVYPITQLLAKDENTLWVGTINGIYTFDKQKKCMTPYDTDTEVGCINMIYQTPDRSLTYFGTYGNGLFIINNKTQEITHYNEQNSGLVTDNIYCIAPDKHGNLLLGTEKGLSQFNIKEHIFINWSKEQGLIPANFNQSAGINAGNGNLIFGSSKGAIIIPDSIELPRTFSSHMVFTNLNIMYKTVHPQETGSPLCKPLNETASIELKYNQNTFSMNVSSINFDNPSNILYSWKLEGFYDLWSPPSSNNLIRYTNLSPGNYTLKVRAILLDNHQVLEERDIQIFVGRPFWLTFWAFLVYALIIIGTSYALIRYQAIKRERRSSREKINFFINTAHDIRTPLTLIKAPLGEILKNEQLSEQGITNINLAIQNTDNLSELANNLINFQKEELYSSRVIVSLHELNQYLRSYLLQFESYASQNKISLTYQSDFESLNVWIDKNKMDSILRNLITNALKYTPQGGKVSLKATHTKNAWSLNITDTGIGISRDDQKRLFKYLFRGANATNQMITGCGIGMLLTYRLIRNHEGKISFQSTENVGTSFQLCFPIKSNRYTYKPEDTATDSTSSVLLQDNTPSTQTGVIAGKESHPDAPLILIVEDNISLRSFLMQSLSDTYRVEGAGNGQEALELIHDQQPDLVLSDVMMPIMDGQELCRNLKGNIETSHIPIILLTALGDKEYILKGLGNKADLYIVKPFDLTVLQANISNVLENRELIRRRYQQHVTQLPDKAETVEEPALSSLDEEFMQQVTAIVKEKLDKDLTVDILCAAMNMSRTSFYNKIKALTGIAPADFIRNIRMQEAALLLKSKRYTVAEVADRMGFADPKYFTDTFKKFYGMPPSVYMKQDNNK